MPTETCEFCGGTGKVFACKDGSFFSGEAGDAPKEAVKQNCLTCRGKGKVVMPENVIKCGFCDNSKKRKRFCLACGGTGKITPSNLR